MKLFCINMELWITSACLSYCIINISWHYNRNRNYSCEDGKIFFLTCQWLEQSLTWDHPSAGHDCFCFSLSWSARKGMLKAPTARFPHMNNHLLRRILSLDTKLPGWLDWPSPPLPRPPLQTTTNWNSYNKTSLVNTKLWKHLCTASKYKIKQKQI